MVEDVRKLSFIDKLIMFYFLANRPKRRGNQSVFDAFRDFQAEASKWYYWTP